MAFSGLGPAGSGGRGRRRYGGSLSEMNVVPLVDVVLVLLIIFMLTASVMEFGLEVDVPTVKTSRTTMEELPVVSIDREGKMYLNDRPVENLNLLGGTIRERFPGDQEVFLRADRTLQWELVMQGMAALGEAGFKIKAVTKPEDIRERR